MQVVVGDGDSEKLGALSLRVLNSFLNHHHPYLTSLPWYAIAPSVPSSVAYLSTVYRLSIAPPMDSSDTDDVPSQ